VVVAEDGEPGRIGDWKLAAEESLVGLERLEVSGSPDLAACLWRVRLHSRVEDCRIGVVENREDGAVETGDDVVLPVASVLNHWIASCAVNLIRQQAQA
jgi:hypothetical protein